MRKDNSRAAKKIQIAQGRLALSKVKVVPDFICEEIELLNGSQLTFWNLVSTQYECCYSGTELIVFLSSSRYASIDKKFVPCKINGLIEMLVRFTKTINTLN